MEATQYKFTGKEEDTEVGLVYFGKRYLNAQLGRWMSFDPLTMHELGADLNGYAYVSGRVLQATDPVGLAVKVAQGTAADAGAPLREWEAELAELESSKVPEWAEPIKIALIAHHWASGLPQAMAASVPDPGVGLNPVAAGAAVVVRGTARGSLAVGRGWRLASKRLSRAIIKMGRMRAHMQLKALSELTSKVRFEAAKGYLRATGSMRVAMREALFKLDPRARGNLVEDILARSDYKKWTRVADQQRGFYEGVDFVRNGGKVQAQVTSYGGGGANLSGLQAKLQKLEGYARENPGIQFVLDIRKRTPEAVAAVQRAVVGNNVTVKVQALR